MPKRETHDARRNRLDAGDRDGRRHPLEEALAGGGDAGAARAHRRPQPGAQRLLPRHAGDGDGGGDRGGGGGHARRRAGAAARRAGIDQGSVRREGPADDEGLAALQGPHRRRLGVLREAADRCRRRAPRQDEHAGVRLHPDDREPHLRRHEQSLGSDAHAGRIERRRGGGRRGGPRPDRAEQRRRRLDPHPRVVLRRLRHQADVRPHPAQARRLDDDDASRPDDAHRRRLGAGARRDVRSRARRPVLDRRLPGLVSRTKWIAA